jgi:tRNA(Ile)-lysidine synthase
VWVAVSGGPDSLALAAAVSWVGHKDGYLVGAIIVDHGLQAGSAEVAARAADEVRKAGVHTVFVETVTVGRDGGLEAAARTARYKALNARIDQEAGLNPHLLTGHTMDDQAETVLLALARGSGARALSGIPARRGRVVRPLLGIRRKDTVAACQALGLTPWNDPTNTDPDGPRRSALRASVMPALADVLGPGVVSGLARSAALLQADADELDRQARAAMVPAAPAASGDDWQCDMLAVLPEAIRTRMLKMLAETHGAGPLTATHVQAMDGLVTAFRGQGGVALPGGYEARREYGRLIFSKTEGGRTG